MAQLRVTLTGSRIGAKPKQRGTLRALERCRGEMLGLKAKCAYFQKF